MHHIKVEANYLADVILFTVIAKFDNTQFLGNKYQQMLK